MATDRTQRQIDRLLDAAEEAFAETDWDRVRDTAGQALLLDPENQDAINFLGAAERALGRVVESPGTSETKPKPRWELHFAAIAKAGQV